MMAMTSTYQSELDIFGQEITRIREQYRDNIKKATNQLLLLCSQLPNFPLTDQERKASNKLKESAKVDKKLESKANGDFDYENSAAYKLIQENYNPMPKNYFLKNMVDEMEEFYKRIYSKDETNYLAMRQQYPHTPPNRQTKRSEIGMYKYFQENYALFEFMIKNGTKFEDFK